MESIFRMKLRLCPSILPHLNQNSLITNRHTVGLKGVQFMTFISGILLALTLQTVQVPGQYIITTTIIIKPMMPARVFQTSKRITDRILIKKEHYCKELRKYILKLLSITWENQPFQKSEVLST